METGTSPQHRTKSSIRYRPFRISDDRAQKVAEFTPGDLLCALESRMRLKWAEGREIDPDRIGEVSRGHNVTVGNEMREIPAGQS